MATPTLALVGAAGGAGTTRTTVEMAATLARAGRSVAVLDAAFGTQGLATYVGGRIPDDVTAVAVGESALEAALYDADYDVAGRVVFCPAHAPFERLARAQAPDAARRLETAVADAASRFDHVLLDVPPVAANPAVAALTTADRRALVAPATPRGADLLPRQRGRLRDLDAPADAVVATRTDAADAIPVEDADYELPAAHPVGPSALDPESPLAPAVAAATEGLLGTDLALEFDEPGLLDRLS
ncbi:MinD/ParA family ATP-binding protein [Haloarcula onubensis]|uniref:ParA family protein n=1 Tax=Haloarcula onubensis TaxID=2950539 RepID=A0ABU2FQ81_9EURY|nr:AAA family ATPase [Halomicroarcula sp. S3CR25-11]MDS0282467.1 ParA family protein [Halomicroarcula sp. S3CR25-11]